MEFVKINDPDIPKENKISYEGFLSKMYNGTFRGFNVIFGNIFD